MQPDTATFYRVLISLNFNLIDQFFFKSSDIKFMDRKVLSFLRRDIQFTMALILHVHFMYFSQLHFSNSNDLFPYINR